LAVVVGLAAIAIASFLSMFKIVWPKRLLGRKTEEVPPVTPKDAILFGIAVFVAFSCLMTAVCLFGMGWSEFVRTASLSVEFGLLIGVGFGAASYIGNNLQHRRAEKRKRRKLDTDL
jgi:amino acid transporter